MHHIIVKLIVSTIFLLPTHHMSSTVHRHPIVSVHKQTVAHKHSAYISAAALAAGSSGSQSYEPISPAQYGNAVTITRTAYNLGLGARGAVIGVATSLQESKLFNWDYGTGLSHGLFQQQAPGFGWGTVSQTLDPVHASVAFFLVLRQVPGWGRLPLYDAAQTVQRAAYPYAYAQWQSEAAHLVAQIINSGKVRT